MHRKADEQNAESGCFEQGVLHANGDELSANEAGGTSCDNEDDVDEGSQSGHELFPFAWLCSCDKPSGYSRYDKIRTTRR